MAFLCFIGVLACIIQLLILSHLPHGRLRVYSIALMELFPVTAAAYFGFTRHSGILDWHFSAMFCLWIAAAILLGYLMAWGIHAIRSQS